MVKSFQDKGDEGGGHKPFMLLLYAPIISRASCRTFVGPLLCWHIQPHDGGTAAWWQ